MLFILIVKMITFLQCRLTTPTAQDHGRSIENGMMLVFPVKNKNTALMVYPSPVTVPSHALVIYVSMDTRYLKVYQ